MATKRARKNMPKSANLYAQVVRNIINQASPHKKRAIIQSISKDQSVNRKEAETLRVVLSKKYARTKQERMRREQTLKMVLSQYKNIPVRKIAETFGIRTAYIYKIRKFQEKGRKAKRAEKMQEAVHAFFHRPDITVQIGGPKGINKKGETVQFLQKTVQEAYKEYIAEEKNPNVGYSTFAKLRPKNVKTYAKMPMNQSVCETCANIDLAIKSFNAISSSSLSKSKAVNISLCKSEGEHPKRACIDRSCVKCGPQLLSSYLSECCPNLNQSTSWNRWTYISGESSKTETNSTTQRKLVLVLVKGTAQELVDTIVSDVNPLAQHIFQAVWQQNQFRFISKNVPDKTLVEVLDFGQNYLCTFQDEAQAAHWNHSQVTIHPVILYYRCDCSKIVRNDIIVISPDLKHDRQAVKVFEDEAVKHIEAETKLTFEKKIQFTDGAASQYKSAFAFHDISQQKNTERHFFGSRHGKGPADAAIGQVKNAVRRAVRSRKAIIRDAPEMFHYCKENFEKIVDCKDNVHTGRTFLFVDKIQREVNSMEIKTVPGTRQIHMIRSTGHVGVIDTQNLSCLIHSDCSEYVDPTKQTSVIRGQERGKSQCKTPSDKLPEIGRLIRAPGKPKKSARTKKASVRDPDYYPPSKKPRKTATNDVTQSKADSKAVKQNLLTATSIQTATSTDEDIFVTLQKELSDCNSYEELILKCSNVPTFPQVQHLAPNLLDNSCMVDKEAMTLKLAEHEVNNLHPANVPADGDCLPHCISLYTGMTTAEIRVRLTVWSVKNEEKLLDHNYLVRGHSAKYDLPTQYAQYSDVMVIPKNRDSRLGKDDIRETLRKEIMDGRTSGRFMGMWQLHALAGMLQRPIKSVYPCDRGLNVRPDVHRLILPAYIAHSSNITILWTSTRNSAWSTKNWRPNHFVPMLPIEKPGTGQLFDDLDDSVHLLDDSLGWLISQLDTSQENLAVEEQDQTLPILVTEEPEGVCVPLVSAECQKGSAPLVSRDIEEEKVPLMSTEPQEESALLSEEEKRGRLPLVPIYHKGENALLSSEEQKGGSVRLTSTESQEESYLLSKEQNRGRLPPVPVYHKGENSLLLSEEQKEESAQLTSTESQEESSLLSKEQNRGRLPPVLVEHIGENSLLLSEEQKGGSVPLTSTEFQEKSALLLEEKKRGYVPCASKKIEEESELLLSEEKEQGILPLVSRELVEKSAPLLSEEKKEGNVPLGAQDGSAGIATLASQGRLEGRQIYQVSKYLIRNRYFDY
jgi:hypothetical protein